VVVIASEGVFVRLLGPFQILKMGQPVSLRSAGKAERLLSCLALHPRVGSIGRPLFSTYGQTPRLLWLASVSTR
jgi:hypothetical protein